MNQLFAEVFIYLFTEIVDIYIDEISPCIEVGISNLFGYLDAGNNFLCILQHI